MKYKTWCLIGLLAAFSFIVLLKGCDRDHSGGRIAAPEGTQVQKVVVRITQAPRPTAKALRLKLEAVGIDDQDAAIGPVIDPVIVNNPVFPCSLNLTLFKPPCRYRLTISADLSRDPARAWQDVINICEPQAGGITIDVFENFLVGDLSITAPESVNAGDAVDVSCTARQIDAPDRDLYPLTLSLKEQGGRTMSSSAPKETASLAETFADPFAITSTETQRLFTCTLADGRSASQVVQKTVARILPTPIPTATPTSTPTPLPTSTLQPPAPKPTPTPNPCVVKNANDSGTGSLRQVLADAPGKGCSTITFATGVSKITLNSQLYISSGAITIDGGGSVTISGNGITRVFYVNGATTYVTFKDLTITEGSADYGGGICNNGGTVTINGIVSNNSATYGGGIGNYGGTVTVNGTVSDNAAQNVGGGIYTRDGTLTVNGTIMNNRATSPVLFCIGGGIASYEGMVIINGIVSNNYAGGNGGGIWTSLAAVTVNGTVSGNEANGGGGICVTDGTVTVNGTISSNTTIGSDSGGGGILIWGTVIFESGNLIQNNKADNGGNGGGIKISSGTIIGTPNYGAGNTPDNCFGSGCP